MGDCLLVERDAEAGAQRELMKYRRNAHRGTEASGLLYDVDTFCITQNLLDWLPSCRI